MTTYHITVEGDILRIGFGDPAQNDQIVRDAAARLNELIQSGELQGGSLLKINGPASIPVAFVLAHKLAHLFGAIAVYDPKLRIDGQDKYVVVITHNPTYQLGDIVT